MRRKLISKYQSRVLLRSANAKFDYGSYRVVGRHTDGFRTGVFQAAHRLNRQRVEFERFDLDSDVASDSGITSIRHPNLSCCIEQFEEGTHAFVVFEPVVGESLADQFERGSLSLGDILRVVRQVADACWVLHSHGLSHGMICPSAVVVADSGDAKLLWRPRRKLTDNDAVGTRLRELAVPFSSKQSNGSKTAADVYSLGKVLQFLTDPLDSVPDQVASVIEGATNEAKRFAHAGVVAALLSDDGQSTAPPIPSPPVADKTAGPAEVEVAVEPPIVSEPASSIGSLAFSDEGSQADRLRERRQASRRKQLFCGGVAAIVAVVGGWFLAREFRTESSLESLVVAPKTVSDGHQSEGSRPNSVADKDASSDVGQSNGSIDNGIGSDEAASVDDGESLWQAPNSGDPIDLSLLPSNSQLYMFIRPSAILANQQSLRALNAFGPNVQSKRADWENSIGVRWEDLETLAAAVVPRDARTPEVCWLIRPTAGWTAPPNWSRGRTTQVLDQTFVQLGDRVVWDTGKGSVSYTHLTLPTICSV